MRYTRLPDWLYVRVERIYRTQRSIREVAARRAVAEQDRRMRYHFMWARFAHANKHCFKDCGYKGCVE